MHSSNVFDNFVTMRLVSNFSEEWYSVSSSPEYLTSNSQSESQTISELSELSNKKTVKSYTRKNSKTTEPGENLDFNYEDDRMSTMWLYNDLDSLDLIGIGAESTDQVTDHSVCTYGTSVGKEMNSQNHTSESSVANKKRRLAYSARERIRKQKLSMAFHNLRQCLPQLENRQPSKIQVIQMAQTYISALSDLLK